MGGLVARQRSEELALVRPLIHRDDEIRIYTGAELRSHWIYETYGLRGDAAVCFRGPVHVDDHLVDLEDKKSGLFIAGEDMLHLIVETFADNLIGAVFRQKLVVLLAGELLAATGTKDLSRRGDDLFFGSGKLSVSIATVSPVSSLVHFGINVGNAGTPLPTSSLTDLGIDATTFAQNLLENYAQTLANMGQATTKVRAVQ